MSNTAETGYTEWQRGVAGVLAKARRVDPSELPANPETLLDAATYDGITISPLYSSRDDLPESTLPGEFPFVRGRDAGRDVNRGWLVSGRFGGTDAAQTNASILDGLENGVGAIWLTVGASGVAAAAIPAALDGVLLDLAPLTLDAGTDVVAAADELFSILDARPADSADVTINLGAAALTSRFSGKADLDLAGTVELAGRSVQRAETVRAITVDGTAFHNAGASDSEELGAAVAAGLEYLRALTGAGVAITAALRQIEFRFAATDDQFQTIAKFRAARTVWARVAQVCGASEFGGAPQHAVTSEAMLAQRDPWVNMLRTTLAAFGAGVGGADYVTVLPFDASLPADAVEASPAFKARMARNTQLLLLEESHLGRVLDPGAGSWYIENLTAAIAEKAWEFFQKIEADGGYVAALEAGSIADAIAATKAQRDSDVAHRRKSITGVNEFPNLAEKPLNTVGSNDVARYGAAFEALRDRSDAYLAAKGVRPRVLIAALGPVAEHNVRTTFASNLLASGGIETVTEDSDATVAILCGTDARYTSEGEAKVTELRAAGITTVLAAGPEKAFTGEARPDHYFTARIDAVAALSQLLETLGA